MEVKSPAVVKRHYDITMSRRTRKQSIAVQTNDQKPTISVTADTTTTKDNVVVSLEKQQQQQKQQGIPEVKEVENVDHKSLKQLIIGDQDHHKDVAVKSNNEDDGGGGEGKGIRNSLGEHFTEEEKQLQLVKMQQKDNQLQGLKFKKLVRRYAKVLGHLMKSKRDPILGDAGKKPVFKLSG